MAVKIYGNKISNCGTGISTQKDANVEIGTNDISDCGTAIELRDPPSFIESMGLKPDTPTDKIVSVLNAISNDATDKDSIEKKVKKVGLLDYLAGAANVSTLVSAFYQLSSSSLVQQALAMLPK
jgi:hypothetical protein